MKNKIKYILKFLLKIKITLIGKIMYKQYKNIIDCIVLNNNTKDIINEVKNNIIYSWRLRHLFDFLYKKIVNKHSYIINATNKSFRNDLCLCGKKYIIINNNDKKTKCEKFKYCFNLKCIYFESETVEFGTFNMNIQLRTVFLKNTKHIKSFAFNNCIMLKTIYIPKTIEQIDQFAFNNCINLKKIIFY